MLFTNNEHMSDTAVAPHSCCLLAEHLIANYSNYPILRLISVLRREAMAKAQAKDKDKAKVYARTTHQLVDHVSP